LIAIDAKHRHCDVGTNSDRLADTARKNEHLNVNLAERPANMTCAPFADKQRIS
jgi:hypothetical protein